jgi:hypothetical protein
MEAINGKKRKRTGVGRSSGGQRLALRQPLGQIIVRLK